MNRKEVAAVIEEIGVIPAIRVTSADQAHFAAEAVASGGIPIVEITMTVTGAMNLISHLVQHHPKMVVGAGTVLDIEMARKCADSGAHFITAPGFDLEIVAFAAKQNIAVLPGAMTPTEIITAFRAGSDFVKVFPCGQLGGESYIRAVNRSLPHIPLIASGGVTQQNAEAFILAGATAIGVGTQLIPTESIEKRQAKRIQELAFRFTKFVREARLRVPPKRMPSETAVAPSPVNCDEK